ncbi:MAG: tandem-95 repeat protein [Zoogloeaceae bacterium]|nr:tandem-95 repeat protein [Zoogloeaceae bacterium]
MADPIITISDASVLESNSSSGPVMNFTVTLSEAAATDVLIKFQTSAATATQGVDYQERSGTLTIAAGLTSGVIAVNTYGDSVAEADEFFVLQLSDPQGASFANGVTTLRAAGTILDNDGTGDKLAVFVDDVRIVEGDAGLQDAVFQVRLSRDPGVPVTLDFTTVDGSALAGTDYIATAGTLTFTPGGALVQEVTVPVLGDTVVEPSDLFSLAFTVPSTIVQASLGEATILDDDAGTPTVSVSGASTTEGSTGADPFYLNFAVTLSAAATSEVTVQYRLLSGSGLAEVDAYFPTSARSVTFAAGETSKTVSVRVNADSVAEPDEAVVLEVFSASGGAALAGNATAVRATGWIIDDDGTGNKLGLYSSQPVLVEADAGSKLAYFELSLSRPAPEALSVSYTTVDGTAVAGEDYVASSGTISFAAGQLSSAVLVPVLGDPDIEPSELFTLALSAPDTVVQTTLGQATILDDDAGLPTVSVGGATALEGSTGSDPYHLSFEVRLSAPATSDVTVDYRLLSGTGEADVDAYFPSSARSVTFIAGEVSKIVNVRVNADTEVEPDERVILELTNVDGGVFAGGLDLLQATGLILDDDGSGNKLGLFVENARIVEGADGVTRQVAVPIVLSRPVDTELTFSFSTASGSAVAGADYIETAGTVTFLPGQTLAAAFVPIIGDGFSEPSETFTLTVTPTAEIANGSDGATGTVTIVDGNVAGPVDGVSVNAGPDAVLDEGATLSRTIIFGDEVDRGGDGWSYEVDWDGDGTADESGVLAAGSSSFNISRLFPDGPASRTVTVKVIDQAGVDEASASFDVTVNDVAPIIALGGAAEIEAGATYTLDLGAISDPGTDSVTEYLVSWGDGATTSVASGGPVTHAYASAGPRTITVALRDEDGLHTSAGSLSLAVLAANTPPVGANDTYSVHSGDTLSIGAAAGLLANDTDADADTLSVVSVGAAANGSLTVAGDGSFTYVPNAGFAGNEFVTYVVSDGVGTATATLAIEVQNESPTAVNDSYSVHSGNTLTVAAGAGVLSNDSDGDGDPFSVLSHGAAANGTISIGADGAFEYTPNAGFAGNEFVTYVVSDGVGTATATLAIEVQNESPTAVNDSYSVHSGNTLTVAAGAGVLSNDSDGDGDPFSVLSHGAAGNGTISIGADGAFEYTPNAGFAGNEFVTYVVSDGVGTATATLAIEVQNESPTAVNDSYSVHSGNTLTVAAGAGVLSNDSDGDGDPFSVLSHGAAGNGTISIGADGAFEYTPNAGFAGNEFVTYVVSDGVGTATATLAIEVQNESPTAVNDSYSVHSGNTLTVAAGAGVLSNDSDGDGDPFSVLSHGAAGNGTISIGADGAFEYTPNAGFAGNEFVTYVVSDGVGTATATLVIEVQNVAPVAGDDTYSVQTGNALVILAPAGVLANDGDPDGDVLSVVSHGDAANGAISIDADGALNYTPNPGFVGAETISYTISDGTSTASGQLTINVTLPGNTPPVAVADSYTVHAGETLTIAAAAGLLANDSDGDGDALSVLSFSAAANGTLNVVTDGSFTYAPNPGFTGTETITYTISDGTTTSSGTLTIEVQNAAPVAVDDSYTVQSGETLTVLAAAGLLANDTDADGDILRAISYSSPSNGVLDVVADGSFTYTSNAGFTGAETISYTISDGTSTASGQLTINVTPPGNTPPVAVADSYTVHAGETLTIAAAAGLLANDSDGDGDALSVLSFSAAANGTLNVVTDGSFTYAPNPGFTGTETITYTISDGTTTSSGTLTIEVQNAAPVAVDDSYTVHAGETLTIAAAAGLLANDSDGDGDALSVLSFSAAANGTLNVVTDGSFTYAPNPGFTGTETITYTISDGTTTSSGTLTIEVQNAAPVAVDDSYTVQSGETLTVLAAAGLLANDTDADGDILRAISYSSPSNGVLDVVADGSFTYTSNAGFTGAETISYTISDGTSTASGQLTINVTPPGNTPPVAVADSYTVHAGETLTIAAAAGLLANDSDGDGDALSVLSFSAAANGTLNVVTDGSFTYAPNPGFTGTETITYTISDGTTTSSARPSGANAPWRR